MLSGLYGFTPTYRSLFTARLLYFGEAATLDLLWSRMSEPTANAGKIMQDKATGA
jgi:hypothetical protein